MKKKLVLNKESLRNLTTNEMGQVAGGTSAIINHVSIVVIPPDRLSMVAACDPTSPIRDRISPIQIVIGS
jgi:hypothetical protein